MSSQVKFPYFLAQFRTLYLKFCILFGAWSLGLSVLGFGFSVVGRLKTVFARWLTQTQNLKH
jgi:hypothetical protein